MEKAMTWLVMSLVLAAGALLQVQIPAPAVLGQVKWPFLMSVVIYYALSREFDVMLIAAFSAGLLQDAMSPIPLGYSVFCFVVAAWILHNLRNLMLTDSLLTMAVSGGVAGLVISIGMYFLLFNEGLLACGAGAVFLKFLGATVTGLICAPPVFLLTGAFDRKMGNVEARGDIDDVE
ncbi:MAG: rod shape-determining protein MreD [Verrucomicrobia bacterium]|nr:rod shape-determining protein MreD [Verrucomicrobiota bacterium]